MVRANQARKKKNTGMIDLKEIKQAQTQLGHILRRRNQRTNKLINRRRGRTG